MATELDLIKIIDLPEVTEFLPGLLSIVSDTAGNSKKATLGRLKEWVNDAPLILNGTGNTPANGDRTTKLATTEYVQNTVSGLGLGIATATQVGTVRTNTTDPAPIVYLKSEIDAFNSSIRSLETGGTGGNTVIAARTSLGVAKSGVNADITQLTALAAVPDVIQAVIDAIIPVGTIIWRASNNAPAGKWTECTGVAVLRIGTFGNLFAEIGTIWGIGNGSTTFNLPKMNGRSPIGAGLTDFQSTRQVGQYFGNENATLTIPNMPSHQHGGATTGIDRTLQHSHAALIGNGGIHGHSTDTFSATNTATAGGGVQRIITGGTGAITINPGGDHNHSVVIGSIDRELDHLHYVQYEGSGTPFNIINPINVMKCYIKY